MTLVISASVIAAATLLGFVLALAAQSRISLLRRCAAIYVLVFRNSPLLVQLFFWYFGVSALLPEDWTVWLNTPHRLQIGEVFISWPSFEFVAGWFGLTLYTTTFISEEFHAGLSGVPEGQRLAAMALGMTASQTFWFVLLPQAVKIAIPPLFGQYMNAVKNSSLTMSIGLVELSYMSRQVDAATFKTFQSYGIATLLYVVIIVALELVLARRQRLQRQS